MRNRYVVESDGHGAGVVRDRSHGRNERPIASCRRIVDAEKIAEALNHSDTSPQLLSVVGELATALYPPGLAYGSGQLLQFTGFQRDGLISVLRAHRVYV